MSIGVTAEQTSAFTVASKEFSGYFTTVFGVTEVFVGLGLTIGPLVGGVLSNYGGFSLPFFVLGGLVLCSLIFNYCLTPSIEDKPQVAKLRRKNGLLLLRHPSIIITCLAVVCGSGVWSVLDPILEPHLATYNLSPTIVGAVFLLLSASYAFSCAICGWIAEKLPDNRLLMIPGFLLCGVAHCLLAPSPIFGFDPSYNELWLIIVSLILLGIAMSMAIIPSYDIIMEIAIESGYPDNLGTHGLVAGLWSAMYALGDFIGPIWGGYIQDLIGFEWGLTYTAGACIVIVILLTGIALYDCYCCEVEDDDDTISEKSSLLKNVAPKRTRAYSEPCLGKRLVPVLEPQSYQFDATESFSSSWTGSSVENMDQYQYFARGNRLSESDHENEIVQSNTSCIQQNGHSSVDFVIPKRTIFRKEVKVAKIHPKGSNGAYPEVTTCNLVHPSTSQLPQTVTSDLIGSNDLDPANQNKNCEYSALKCSDTMQDLSQLSAKPGAKENSPQTLIQNGCLLPECDSNGAKCEDYLNSNLPDERTNKEIKFPQSHEFTKDVCETVNPAENGVCLENGACLEIGAETKIKSCESFKNPETNADLKSCSEENVCKANLETPKDLSAICNIYPKVVICKPLGNHDDSDVSVSSNENEENQASGKSKATLPKIIIPKPKLYVKHSMDSKHDKMAAKPSAHVKTQNQVLINRRNGIRSPLIKTFTEAYKSGMIESTSYHRRYKRTLSTPEYSVRAPDYPKEKRSHTSPDSDHTYKHPEMEASNNFVQFPDLPTLPLL
ncbi:hypothetical protein LOTGIDRAFT_238826 [Lottia gigantea]|uniref:Major facilitator superfamily (MFS) profile domain-containing protein n=1 Tax=Lottia gigantea TaxID=225164 RepID=V4A5H7_LOTGI|nr:hypothetical protein LOTGIDRAFT_238826 [Lottia gigantea]ESO99178.1 hypothetical protein LOTGIDRAFT_238826 [Lottia gigantea]